MQPARLTRGRVAYLLNSAGVSSVYVKGGRKTL